MRLITTSLLVGAAVLALGAFALPASGKDPAFHEITVHEMTIPLPGGGTETIRYTDDVAPKVRFSQAPVDVVWPATAAFGFEPSFAAMDQIATDLDRQMDALWHQAQSNWLAHLSPASLPNLAPGSSAYSFVSEAYGNNVCTRMTEITTSPDAGKPKVVSRTSGNCDASPAGALSGPNPLSTGTIAVHSAIPANTVRRTAL